MIHAAPLDFLFGEPPLAERPAYRLRRRPAPASTTTPADVPLPVPRPHFTGDPPTTAVEADRSLPAAVAPPPEASPQTATQPAPAKPSSAPGVANASPPLPPSKPADLEKPAAVPPPPQVTAPAGSKTPDKVVQPAPAPETTSPNVGASPPVTGSAPLPPPKPPEIASPEPSRPEPTKPSVAPSGATTAFTPRAPEDDPACPSRLQGLKVDVAPTTIPPQPDARCTVVQPVRLAGMTLADGARIDFPDHPTIACTTADSFSSYLRDLMAPLSRGTFGAPLTAVWTGPGLECRSRDSVFGAKLSAHGQGLAIDIAQLKLADGRLVEVGTPKTDAETRFETAARAGACGYFHTVLGPGSDAYHRTHWHFDLEVRGRQGDSKYCK